jgi:hypothetical protein
VHTHDRTNVRHGVTLPRKSYVSDKVSCQHVGLISRNMTPFIKFLNEDHMGIPNMESTADTASDSSQRPRKKSRRGVSAFTKVAARMQASAAAGGSSSGNNNVGSSGGGSGGNSSSAAAAAAAASAHAKANSGSSSSRSSSRRRSKKPRIQADIQALEPEEDSSDADHKVDAEDTNSVQILEVDSEEPSEEQSTPTPNTTAKGKGKGKAKKSKASSNSKKAASSATKSEQSKLVDLDWPYDSEVAQHDMIHKALWVKWNAPAKSGEQDAW